MPTTTLKPYNSLASRLAIVAVVVALHLGVIYGYLLWKGKIHPAWMMIHVKLIPADAGPPSSPAPLH